MYINAQLIPIYYQLVNALLVSFVSYFQQSHINQVLSFELLFDLLEWVIIIIYDELPNKSICLIHDQCKLNTCLHLCASFQFQLAVIITQFT